MRVIEKYPDLIGWNNIPKGAVFRCDNGSDNEMLKLDASYSIKTPTGDCIVNAVVLGSGQLVSFDEAVKYYQILDAELIVQVGK
jgi:hypothetical protein